MRRKALRSGVFGGDRRWLGVFVTMFLWRQIKGLFGFGEPQPVFVSEAEPGELVIVAHEEDKSTRRKRRKTENKQAKKAAKSDKKAAKAAEKHAADKARKVEKAVARSARKAATV